MTLFSAGDFAVEEGDVGSEVYFIAHGTLQVLVQNREMTLLSDGDCFGEIALLLPGTRRTASIVAVTFCECHCLSQDRFNHCLEGFPDLRARLQKLAEDRVQQMAEQAATQEAKATIRKPSMNPNPSKGTWNPKGGGSRGSTVSVSAISAFACVADATHHVAEQASRRLSHVDSRSSNTSDPHTPNPKSTATTNKSARAASMRVVGQSGFAAMAGESTHQMRQGSVNIPSSLFERWSSSSFKQSNRNSRSDCDCQDSQ